MMLAPDSPPAARSVAALAFTAIPFPCNLCWRC
jgi:hypothetical protein